MTASRSHISYRLAERVATLVDNLGIEKLFELIEQHVGKRAAKGVLYLVTAAISVAAIHYIFQFFVFPLTDALLEIAKVVSKQSEEDGRKLVANILFSSLAATIGAFLGNIIISILSRRVHRAMAELKEHAALVETEKKRLQAATNRASGIADRLAEMVLKVNSHVDTLIERQANQ